MFTIIEADPEKHASDIRKLIQELADFEKMPEGPKISADQIAQSLKEGRCHAFVALDQNETVVGYTIYYVAYSTWEGPYLFMEDLYVTPAFRAKGLGKKLWQKVAQVADKGNMPRVEFAVLNWNTKAIEFYKKMGAIDMTEKEGWLMYRLMRDDVRKLANH